MIGTPKGFRRSVNVHNIDRDIFLDWLESTVILSGEELAKPDLVDHLIDQQLYDSQEFAWDFVAEMWDEFKARLAWLGQHSPIAFYDEFASIRANELNWSSVPAHSFCLAVSIGPKFDGWSGQFQSTLNEQGMLFELITKAAMETRFSQWQFIHTGWGSENITKLEDIVNRIVDCTGNQAGNLAYASEDANDAGVDLVWHLPFVDGRGGVPVYLAQCASGFNWQHKIGEPDIGTWGRIIEFAVQPNAAFSIPFSLNQTDLRRHSARSNTQLLLDRYRLLAQDAPELQWVPDDLQSRLITWLEPKVNWLMTR